MDQSGQFSDYLFAKMGPSNGGTNGGDFSRNTTERCQTPVELTGIKKWISDNAMLLVTLSGVLFGVSLGELFYFIFIRCITKNIHHGKFYHFSYNKRMKV